MPKVMEGEDGDPGSLPGTVHSALLPPCWGLTVLRPHRRQGKLLSENGVMWGSGLAPQPERKEARRPGSHWASPINRVDR